MRGNEPGDSEELLKRVQAFESETFKESLIVNYHLAIGYTIMCLQNSHIVTTQRENFINEDYHPHNVSPYNTIEYASSEADLVIYKDELRNDCR